MKRSILTLTLLSCILAASPSLYARDYDRDRDSDHRDSYGDLRSELHKLWDWYGHLKGEAQDRGASRHVFKRLDEMHSYLRHVDDELHDGRRDRVSGELDAIRDGLRHISEEMHAHSDWKPRPGITLEFH